MKSKFFMKIDCPVCGEKKYETLYESNLEPKDFSQKVLTDNFKNSLSNYTKHAQIVRCSKCDLTYVNPRENPKNYIDAYNDVVDDEYLHTEMFRKILAQKHLNNLQRYKNKGNILDIGCFAGYFLELAMKNHWIAHGIEPSKWASKIAAKKRIKIIGHSIEETKLKSEFYDAITMWDVIEHLANPKATILKAKDALKVNGLLAIGTPDVESLMFKILRGNHPYFIRMHLVLFSPKTLSILLEKNGFEILKIYKYGRTYSINYFLARIETKLKFVGYLKKFTSHNFFNNYPVTLNLRDEFVVIARKKIS